MSGPHKASLLTCVTLLLLPAFAAAQSDASSFSRWLQQGSWLLDSRYRIEQVDQDTFPEDALASTLRLSGGYETGRWNGFSALIEAELVRPIGGEQFNSTTNGRGAYPVVADPDTSEINRAYLYYRRASNHVIAGRQVLPIKQERFLGSVNFRQNQQTYDAIMLMNRSYPGWTLVYGYMDRVRRFLGDDNPVGDIDMNSHIVDIEFLTPNEDRLTIYGQFLDMETPVVTAASHRNIGIRFQGSGGKEALKWLYHLEYADQSSYADGANIIDADYWRAEIGPRFANQWLLQFGIEHLGGNGTYAFQTPFATGHAFQGRADVFAGRTPDNGVRDQYVRLEAPVLGARVSLSLHQFDSDAGSIDYGSEIDLVIAYRFRKNFQVDAEYSAYDANAFATDKNRFSISLRYSL
ncbi:MAG: hypothetical protein ACR2RD_00715 [Woeseiaceae bacterium]